MKTPVKEPREVLNLSNLLSGRRVLLVEDASFNLAIVSRMLREMGCWEVLTANSGTQGLAILQSPQGRSLDAVILDHHLPDISGLTILKLIRTGATAVPAGLPAAMLTCANEETVVKAAFELRIDAYMVKPISKTLLGERLSKILSPHAASPSARGGAGPGEGPPRAHPPTPARRFHFPAPPLPAPEGNFDSFEALCEAAILRRVDKLLLFFRRGNPEMVHDLPPLFLMSPVFAKRLRAAISTLILPRILENRAIRRQAAGVDLRETDSETFWSRAGDRLGEAIQTAWDDAWDALRLVEEDENGERRLKIRETTKHLRRLLPHEDRTDYEQPKIGNYEIDLFKSLLDTGTDRRPALDVLWQALQHLYEQEMEQEKARDGAFRDGLLGGFARFPGPWMDVLTLTCHRVYPGLSTNFLKRIVTHFGATPAEQVERLPYTTVFLRQMQEQPEQVLFRHSRLAQ